MLAEAVVRVQSRKHRKKFFLYFSSFHKIKRLCCSNSVTMQGVATLKKPKKIKIAGLPSVSKLHVLLACTSLSDVHMWKVPSNWDACVCGRVCKCMYLQECVSVCRNACFCISRHPRAGEGGAIIKANKITTNKQSLFWASPCCTTPRHKPACTGMANAENVLRCAA